MAQPDRPLFRDLQDELAAMASEAREMLALRWELARLELRDDARCGQRLVRGAVIAIVTALTALPLLVAAVAHALAFWTETSVAMWLALCGLALAAAAGVIAYTAWRRFRREFAGMAETLEELREDLVWLREWQRGKMTSVE